MPPEKIRTEDKLIFCPNGLFGTADLEEYFSWREISRDILLIGDILGQGEFGLVTKAVVTDLDSGDIPVAVKSVKGKSGKRKAFVSTI